MSEEELIEKWLQYAPTLKKFFAYKLSHMDADDLVSEVFIRVWTSYKKGHKITYVKGYAYHIASNLVIDMYRKFSRRFSDTSLDQGDFNLEDLPGVVPVTETNYEDQLDGEIASKILFDMPENHVRVLYLYLYEELTIVEISERLKIPVSTAAVQLHRARKFIKLEYEKRAS